MQLDKSIQVQMQQRDSSMKYIKIAIIVLLFLNLTQVPVWALTTPRVTAIQERLTLAPTKFAQREDTRLTAIKTSADKMIDQRVATLQTLLTHVTQDSKLPSDDVTAFTTDINTTISSLQTLKTKIDADTDVTTALADRKSIVTSYRIYLIFEPKLRLLIAVDNLQAVNQKLATLSGSLTTLITNLKSEGKDVTTMQTALTDINIKLADATTKLANAKSALLAITTSQAGQQPFVAVKQDLATVRQDYAAIRADFAKIRAGLGALKPTTTPAVSTTSAH